MECSDEERLELMVAALDRLLASELASVRREMVLNLSTASRAVEVAQSEAKERLAAHNGLIEQMRSQSAHFATREVVDLNREAYLKRFEQIDHFQNRVMGALVLLAVSMPLLTVLLDHWIAI